MKIRNVIKIMTADEVRLPHNFPVTPDEWNYLKANHPMYGDSLFKADREELKRFEDYRKSRKKPNFWGEEVGAGVSKKLRKAIRKLVSQKQQTPTKI